MQGGHGGMQEETTFEMGLEDLRELGKNSLVNSAGWEGRQGVCCNKEKGRLNFFLSKTTQEESPS